MYNTHNSRGGEKYVDEQTVFFTINKKTLSQAFKEINKLILRKKSERAKNVIEIESDNGSAEIKSIGIVLTTDCDTNFNGKIMIPYPIFQIIAEFSKQEVVYLEIKNGEISFDNKRYKADKIIILDSITDDEFYLSMNYTPLELISLRKKFNEASIERCS